MSLHDLRFGLRELLRHRLYSATAIASLAFGIMAATAMYSVIHGVVLNPFPYRDIDNLVSIGIRDPARNGPSTQYNVADFAELSRRATIFDGIAGSTISDVLWISNGEPLRLRGNHLSNGAFDTMGVPALLGRTVTTHDPNPETLAVLGYRFWVRQFGSDPNILGRTLILNDRPRTIVGVMPPRFMFRGADVYLPLDYTRESNLEGVQFVHAAARRRPGTTDAEINAALTPIFADLAQANPTRFPQTWRAQVISFIETFPSDIRDVLWIMFGAAGLLLLISCANVSSLLLVRATARQREFAVRNALGAPRSRLFRQLLTESLLLGITGGLLGIVLSWLAIKFILNIAPPNVIPDEAEITLNTTVLAFSVAVSLLTALVFGLAPALHASGRGIAQSLLESGRGSSGSAQARWLRGALVVTELSLAIVLLSGAGIFLRNLLQAYSAPAAIETENRLTMRVPMFGSARYQTIESRNAFLAQLNDRIAALPGVLSVGNNAGLHPFYSWNLPVEIPGQTPLPDRPVNVHQVNAGYLKTLGIALRTGRAFESADISSRRHVMLVNETFAAQYFPGQSPIGKTVRIPRFRDAPFKVANDTFEITGTVEDAMIDDDNNFQSRPEVYVPYTHAALAGIFVVHTAGPPMRLAQQIKAQVYAIDGSQFVDEVRTLDEQLDRFLLSNRRFQLWLIAIFATLGLTLAVIGVFGLLSQFVTLQVREFGMRMAVGANSGDILRLVLIRGARLIALGLAIGTATTLLLLKRYGPMLGIKDSHDAPALAGACAILAIAALAASLLPAFRASRIDPVDALRAE
ncbi:MAG: ABC transporter permease [Acidobacteriota bacterium]